MITYEDCLALTDLTEEEVAAIAANQRLPAMLALELGTYLSRCDGGRERIERMIDDDIAAARGRGQHARAARLRAVLRHFRDADRRA